MPQAQVSAPSGVVGVPLDRLAQCVSRLDPATRALLDLSVRRGVRDDQMAPILRIDPFHLAWRRARALDRLASEVADGDTPAPLGEVRMALEALPRVAWGLPVPGQPALPPPRERSADLVPVAPPGRMARLDAFASESPPLRLALGQLGRAIAAKAVRLVVWPRRGAA
jgi:hypothetical protein